MAFLVAALAAADVSAYAVPPFTSYVVDKTGTLSSQENARLEQKLAAYQRQTGQQMALLIVPDVTDDTPEGYAVQVFNTWKLGQKGKDDGLLMLVVMDQRKVKIEVGDGLEGDVTDVVSGRIIRNVMVPAFQSGDYAGGIDHAFDALMTAASGSAVQGGGEQAHEHRARRTSSPAMIFFFILFVIISSLGRRRRYGGWMLWGVGNALLGGRSSGGGFFGGGGGGGGFGGGGGGRSSGGGASGGW